MFGYMFTWIAGSFIGWLITGAELERLEYPIQSSIFVLLYTLILYFVARVRF